MPLTKAPCTLLKMSTDPLTNPIPVDITQHDVVILFNDTLYYADGTTNGLWTLDPEARTQDAYTALTNTLSAMTEGVSQLADAATLELISTVSHISRIDYTLDRNLSTRWIDVVRTATTINENPYNYLLACEALSSALNQFQIKNEEGCGAEQYKNCAAQLARQNPLRVTQQQGEIMLQLYSSFSGYHGALTNIDRKKRSATQKEHLQQLDENQKVDALPNTLQERQALLDNVLRALLPVTLLPDNARFNADIDIEPNYQFPEFFHALQQTTAHLNTTTKSTAQEIKLLKQIKQQAIHLANKATPKEMEKLTEVMTATHTALTSKTPESATALAQAGNSLGKNSRWKFLGGAALVLGGFLLIAASVGAAMVSFGALSPLSVAGVALGANIMAGGIAVGVGATAMIGTSKLGASSFFTKQLQKDRIEESATKLSRCVVAPN